MAIDKNPHLKILILEKNREPLQKVKVSGGGRCNVTHYCFEPLKLILNYPRGKEFLLDPFSRFGPAETIEWFSQKNVKIKKEGDGRMFPETNSSQTIIDCFMQPVQEGKIELATNSKVLSIEKSKGWLLKTVDHTFEAKNIMLCTGSDPYLWDWLRQNEINIIPPVPSLFTFKIDDKNLQQLSGVSVPKAVVKYKDNQQFGPLLITHWGFSGPAVLKLSAFEAIRLAEQQHQFKIKVDWLPDVSEQDLLQALKQLQAIEKKKVFNTPILGIPTRLWEYFCNKVGINPFQNWQETGKKHFAAFILIIKNQSFEVNGKTTFKEEFVTAGGIDTEEVNPDTFELKKIPSLFVAGEILNIDAITGGFNFQAAWCGAWHVGATV